MTLDLHVAGGRPTLITDLSPGMVEYARRRAAALDPASTAHLEFAAADAFRVGESAAVPGREPQLQTVLGLGILHMVPDPEALVDTLGAVCAPGATLWLTGLVAGRRLSSLYLSALARAGEVVRPRTADPLRTAFGAAGPVQNPSSRRTMASSSRRPRRVGTTRPPSAALPSTSPSLIKAPICARAEMPPSGAWSSTEISSPSARRTPSMTCSSRRASASGVSRPTAGETPVPSRWA